MSLDDASAMGAFNEVEKLLAGGVDIEFCPDLVEHNFEIMAALTEHLATSRRLHRWWDSQGARRLSARGIAMDSTFSTDMQTWRTETGRGSPRLPSGIIEKERDVMRAVGELLLACPTTRR